MRSGDSALSAVASFAGRAFFARDTVSVARDLVGADIVMDGGAVIARLVEVEAYLGVDDAASHAFRGSTQRTRIMFAEPGHLYVYLSYGMHHCVNLVTEGNGTAGAVLLRAATVITGENVVQGRRSSQGQPGSADAALLRGPGNLCRGLDISRGDNGVDVCAAQARLRIRIAEHRPEIAATPRVGITRNVAADLRFIWTGHPALSRPRT